MNLSKLYASLFILTGVMAPAFHARALPSTQSNSQFAAPQLISLQFPDSPSSKGAVSTVGGGHRGGGSCSLENKVPLTVLMPSDRNVKSISANPSLFVYVPETTASLGEFYITDEQGNEIHYQELDLPEKSGLLKLNLPQTVVLKSSQAYEWNFAIVCDPFDSSSNETISGSLTRFSLEENKNLTEDLKKSQAKIKQAQIYAQHQVWNETISLVAEVRDTHPTEWQELLKSVGINNSQIIEAPLFNIPPTK